MSMKKIILSFFIVIFLFSACTNKSETQNYQSENQTSVSIAEKGLDIEPDEGLEIVKNIADFTEVKENQEYNFETDNQNISQNYTCEDCLETRESYYFYRNGRLYVFDKAKKTYSLLCNKPDCSHFGETCNAFFPYDCEGMEYYKGNIYMLIRESSELDEKDNNDGLWQETLELYRMSLDGTERTRICTAATVIAQKDVIDNDFSVWYIKVHRGYLYYIYNYGTGGGNERSFYANNSNTLYRIPLDGKGQKECICTIEHGGLASAVDLFFQGSYMYFIKADFVHEGTGYGNLYRLNTESMKLEYMDIGEISCFIVNGDEIVYITLENGKYYSYNTKTWEKKVFFEPEPRGDLTYGYMLYDSNYYYFNLFNMESLEYICEVYNEQLEKVGEYDRTTFEVKNNDNELVYAYYQPGNSDYDFMITYDGSILYYLDKSLIGTGTEKFVQVKAE